MVDDSLKVTIVDMKSGQVFVDGKLINREKHCCGEAPLVWRCYCQSTKFCGCDVEKIECLVCGRIVYGGEDEDIERWNAGDNDD